MSEEYDKSPQQFIAEQTQHIANLKRERDTALAQVAEMRAEIARMEER